MDPIGASPLQDDNFPYASSSSSGTASRWMALPWTGSSSSSKVARWRALFIMSALRCRLALCIEESMRLAALLEAMRWMASDFCEYVEVMRCFLFLNVNGFAGLP